MTNEDKFKQSLNNLLNQKEFVFEESDWIAASKLIDSRRKKRRFGFYFLSGILLLGLSVIGFSLMQPTIKKQISFNESNKQHLEETKSTTPTSSKRNQNLVKMNSESSERTKSEFSNYANKDIDIKKISELNTQVKSNQNAVRNIPSSIPLTTQTASSLPGVTNVQNDFATIESNQNADNTEQNIVNNFQDPTITTLINTTTNPITSITEQFNYSTRVDEEKNTTIIIANNSHANTNVLTQELIPISKQDEVKLNADSIILQSSVAKIDSTGKHSIASISDTLKPTDLYASNELYIDAGGLLNFGWKNSNTREAMSISPALGLMFTSRITNQFVFSIGIGYHHISNLTYSNKQSKITRYGIGEYSKVTTITPYKTQFINIPIKLHYSLTKQNVIGIGYHISYLLDVQSKVETYTQQLADKVDYETYKTGGYTEGFKTFNSQLSVFYRRNIYRKFWVQAELTYGLTDLKENSFFNTPTFERNSGLKISLLYNFYKK